MTQPDTLLPEPDRSWEPGAEKAIEQAIEDSLRRLIERSLAKAAGPKARIGTRHDTKPRDPAMQAQVALDLTQIGLDPDAWAETVTTALMPSTRMTVRAAFAALAIALGVSTPNDPTIEAAALALARSLGDSAGTIATDAQTNASTVDTPGATLDAVLGALRHTFDRAPVLATSLGINGVTLATSVAGTLLGAALTGGSVTAIAGGAVAGAVGGAGAAGIVHGLNGLLAQKWVTMHDDRVRPTHRAAEGQVRPIGSPFLVGGAPMRYPGDRNGPIGEWIGCRCRTRLTVEKPNTSTVPNAPAEKMVRLYRPATDESEQFLDVAERIVDTIKAAAPLPEGWRVEPVPETKEYREEFHPREHGRWVAKMDHPTDSEPINLHQKWSGSEGQVFAVHRGNVIGGLRWDADGEPPKVIDMSVHPDYRRMGVGTRMFEVAKDHQSQLEHSDTLTDDGRAFVASFKDLHFEGLHPRLHGHFAAKPGSTPSHFTHPLTGEAMLNKGGVGDIFEHLFAAKGSPLVAKHFGLKPREYRMIAGAGAGTARNTPLDFALDHSYGGELKTMNARTPTLRTYLSPSAIARKEAACKDEGLKPVLVAQVVDQENGLVNVYVFEGFSSPRVTKMTKVGSYGYSIEDFTDAERRAAGQKALDTHPPSVAIPPGSLVLTLDPDDLHPVLWTEPEKTETKDAHFEELHPRLHGRFTSKPGMLEAIDQHLALHAGHLPTRTAEGLPADEKTLRSLPDEDLLDHQTRDVLTEMRRGLDDPTKVGLIRRYASGNVGAVQVFDKDMYDNIEKRGKIPEGHVLLTEEHFTQVRNDAREQALKALAVEADRISQREAVLAKIAVTKALTRRIVEEFDKNYRGNRRDDDLEWFMHIGYLDGEETVSHLVGLWAGTSNDSSPESLAIQSLAADEFGVEQGLNWKTDPATALAARQFRIEHEPLLRAFLRAQYAATQERLKAEGVTEVTVARGMSFEDDDPMIGLWPPGATKSRSFRPLTSWTTRRRAAELFAESSTDEGRVVVTTVPAERVFSLPRTGVGCLDEFEVVVLGGMIDVQIHDATYARGGLTMKAAVSRATDNATRNEDWIKTLSWDVRTPDGQPVTDLAGLARAWALTPAVAAERLASLPCAEAAPPGLLSGSEGKSFDPTEHPRDSHGRWFHGSAHVFAPGTILSPQGEGDRSEHVYLADNRRTASRYAEHALSRQTGMMSPGGGHVYEVEPIDAVEKDDVQEFGGEHRVAGQVRVVREVPRVSPQGEEIPVPDVEQDVPGKKYTRLDLQGHEIQPGDRLDRAGKIRVHTVRTHPETGATSVFWRQRGSRAPGVTVHPAGHRTTIYRPTSAVEAARQT